MKTAECVAFYLFCLLTYTVGLPTSDDSVAVNDEFYCKVQRDNWHVCRRCNETSEDCDGTSLPSDGCRCEDIKLKDPISFKLTGGWETCEEEGWCYVRYSYEENPKCKDQDWYEGSDEYSPNPGSDVGTKSYIWLTNQTNGDWEGLGKSKQACKGVKKYSTGNEEVLKEVKINSDFLLSENDEKIMLPLIGPDYDDWIKSDAFTEYTKWLKTTNIDDEPLYRLCHYQCYVRNQPNMVCSAWSFDTINSICHLHKVGACCGQRDKQKDDISFISGYICPHCWSTRKDCPCGIETLAQSSGTAHRGTGTGGPGYGVNSLSG